MGIFSFLSKPKPPIPSKPPDFHFIYGEYIYDSNDFEVIAYAEYDVDSTTHYLMKNKSSRDYFIYKYDPKYPNERPKRCLSSYDRSYAMSTYLEFSEKKWYLNPHFNKTYEEAFDIKLKPLGKKVPDNNNEQQSTSCKSGEDPNELEIMGEQT